MKEKLRPVINSGKDFASRMGERKLPIYATSGCYYLFMSLVPIAMIFCCILPYTPFRQEVILNYIDTYFAESLGDILRRIVNAVYSSNAATMTVSILLTLYSASASMKSLMNGMDAAYHCKKKNNFIVFTVRALLYMVILVATLLVALVIMVFGGRILALLRRYFAAIGFLSLILSRSRYLLVMIILFLVFTILYTLMPAEKVRLRDQVPGAIFSAVIWVVFSGVFTIYVDISNKYGAYGVIGTVMVTMMWGYYCLYFLLIGGFLNSYLTDARIAAEEKSVPSAEVLSPGSASEEEKALTFNRDDSPEKPADSDSPELSKPKDPADNDSPELSDPEDYAEDDFPELSGAQTGEASGKKKKLRVPLIAGIGAAAAALIAGLILFLRRRKKGKRHH